MIARAQITSDHEFFAPLCEGWRGRLREAERHKKPFNSVASQCMQFFSGSADFMWKTDYLQKHVGNIPAPTFKICIHKAFELVALFGPTLYWRNPVRVIKPRRLMDLDPSFFAGDPQAQELMAWAQQDQQQRKGRNQCVSALLDAYLNYTPLEQPQGLAWHAKEMITEALIKGRGCLWPAPYTPPGGGRVLTGCFYDSVDNLLIDPDATNLHDGKWIAQKVVETTWQAEKRFHLPEGSLNRYGDTQSSWRQGGSGGSTDGLGYRLDRAGPGDCDLITYWKIYSKVGIGTRFQGIEKVDDKLGKSLENVVGDYAYIVVSQNAPWPLNAPSQWIRTADDSQIEKRLRWPIPFWMDNRWPVAVLDFYNRPNDPWAIAPIAPGLGELSFLNIIISSLANRIHTSSRTFLAHRRGLSAENKAKLESGADFSTIDLEATDGPISEVVQFLQYPESKTDVWKIIEQVFALFDRRTGLTELLSGLSPGGKVTRVAEDVKTRREMVSVRPEYMASRVEDTLTEASDMEKMCASQFVQPAHLSGLFGPAEQHLWKKHITDAPRESIMREFKATLMANSARRPDKARDMENVQQLLQYFGPYAAQFAFESGGGFAPLNAMMKTWGKAADEEVEEMLMNPPEEAGNEEAAAAQEEIQRQQQEFQSKMQQSDQQHQQRMHHRQEDHQQRSQSSEQLHSQKLNSVSSSHAQGLENQADQARFSTFDFQRDAGQDEQQHDQGMRHREEDHIQKAKLAQSMASTQQKIASRRAATNGSKNGSEKR